MPWYDIVVHGAPLAALLRQAPNFPGLGLVVQLQVLVIIDVFVTVLVKRTTIHLPTPGQGRISRGKCLPNTGDMVVYSKPAKRF